jgi:hypothetical protein
MASRARPPNGLWPVLFLTALLVWAAWPWLPLARAAAPPTTIVF